MNPLNPLPHGVKSSPRQPAKNSEKIFSFSLFDLIPVTHYSDADVFRSCSFNVIVNIASHADANNSNGDLFNMFAVASYRNWQTFNRDSFNMIGSFSSPLVAVSGTDHGMCLASMVTAQ